jgi:membrane protein implicated in regulation of membrane protease activity
MMLIGTWWAWVSFGILLVILELIVPSYFFLGFGIGAVMTGILMLLGVSLSLQNLVLTFAVLSFVSWIAVKRIFRHPRTEVKTFDHDINDN